MTLVRTEKGKPMDSLAKNAMLAKQAGLSYGKWKALQPIVPIVKKTTIPEGWKKCEYCGTHFKPHKGQRFCQVYCRQQAYKQRDEVKAKNASYMRKYKKRQQSEEK